jgi:hypothetical protein
MLEIWGARWGAVGARQRASESGRKMDFWFVMLLLQYDRIVLFIYVVCMNSLGFCPNCMCVCECLIMVCGLPFALIVQTIGLTVVRSAYFQQNITGKLGPPHQEKPHLLTEVKTG